MTAEVFTPSDVNVTATLAVKHVRKQLDKKPEAKGIRLAIKERLFRFQVRNPVVKHRIR